MNFTPYFHEQGVNYSFGKTLARALIIVTLFRCRYSSRSAASDLRRQAARGRPNPERLQHPEGVDTPPGVASARWSEEEEEEELHDPEEEQAQEEEGEARRAQVLQGEWSYGGFGRDLSFKFHHRLFSAAFCVPIPKLRQIPKQSDQKMATFFIYRVTITKFVP